MISIKIVLLITGIIMVSTASQAEALQQTAAKLNYVLELGETQTLQWGIISDEDVMTTLEIRAEGKGSELLSFQNSINAEPHKMTWIDFTVTVPDDYQNDIELRPAIFALQKSIDEGIGGALINIEMRTVTSIKIGDPPEPEESIPEPNLDPEPKTVPDPEKPKQPEGTTFNMEPTTDPEPVLDPEPTGGGCLIATAAYGTELAPQVQFLREIRDNTVMSTASGMSFMTGFNQLYYSFSPTIADWERENPMFQEAVRAFITPMISTLSIMTLAEDGNDIQVLGLGIAVIILNLGMYIAMPTVAAHKIISWHKRVYTDAEHI